MSKIAVSNLSNIHITKKDFSYILNIFIGFIIGQATILNFINPFALGYVSVFLGKDKKSFILISISVILGLMNNYYGIYTLSHISSIILLIFINSKRKKFEKIYKGIIGLMVAIISSLIVLIQDFTIYFILAYFTYFSITFLLPSLINEGIKVLSFEKKGEILSTNEIISLVIIFFPVLLGAYNININFIYLDLYMIVTIGLVLSTTNNLTLGTGAIVILSFIPVIKNQISGNMVLALCISSIFASFPKNNQKYKILLCFSLGLLVSYFYLEKNIIDEKIILTILSAYFTFFLIPKYFYIKLQKTFANTNNNWIDYGYRINFYTKERIKNYGNVFKDLSKTYKNMDFPNKKITKESMGIIIDNTVNDTCLNCKRKNICWEKKFYLTKKIVENIMISINESSPDKKEMEKHLVRLCIFYPDFMESLEKNYKIFENEIQWENKLINNKRIIGEQFYDISGIFDNVYNDLNNKLNFFPEKENMLFKEMEKNNFVVKSVVIMEDERKIANIWIKTKININEREGLKKIEKLVSTILNKKFILDEFYRQEKNLYEIFLLESNKINVMTGVAKVNKNDSAISGDSYSTYKIKNKEMILAVSDGMGSGIKANLDSHMAIELFEDFIEAGFSKEVALKLINSSLVLKSTEERFTTFDAVCINLYDGVSQFIKVGASPSFIIGEDKIDIVHSNSLPIGILNNIKSENTTRKLKKGDTIILLTDGVLEVIKDTKEQIEWMTNILWENKNKTPVDLSKTIIKEALYMCNGQEGDDMTCVVGKII